VLQILRRLIIALSAAVAIAIFAAIALAILDLYLAGHAYAEIRKESVSWPAAGVHLSIADLLLLALAFGAAAVGWILSRPRS
jgi:hypothetical protein